MPKTLLIDDSNHSENTRFKITEKLVVKSRVQINKFKSFSDQAKPSGHASRKYSCTTLYNHLISNKRDWNNYFIKNAPKI